jgi:hypothetical protein
MGYFDAYTATLFRADADGRRVMTPWGNRGPVYVVERDADATRISGAVRRMYQLMLPLVIGSTILLGWRWTIVVVVLWSTAFYGVLHAVTRRLPRAAIGARDLPKARHAELQQRVGRAMGRRWLVALLVGSLAFVAVCAWLLAMTGPSAAALLGLAYFGLCAGVFAYQLRRTSSVQ